MRHDLVRRPRRLRRTAALRALTRETRLSPERFVYPLFVRPGRDVREPIGPMPGQFRLSVDRLAEEAAELRQLGIRAVLLFGIPESKDALGSGAYDPDGIVPRAIRALREADPELVIAADVCLCEYTTHGHCGVIRNGQVDNDETLELLERTATALAAAGADIVAPSAMMDGQVGAIRRALDAAGQHQVAVMAYSAKYASVFYGPFREAAHSAPRTGDRRGYQMDPASGARQAVDEALLDVEEGADMVMVKPALPYLDVIRAVRESCLLPVAAYQVSGEYAMLRAAAERGWIDERAAALETLTAVKRAGADFILTYYARRAARWLRGEQ
ncbi:MAG: porphobilinogen synthase [Peptococcaceae bacterium]|nr:porphobilinogen synthase [Peptococcaceae bacterium]